MRRERNQRIKSEMNAARSSACPRSLRLHPHVLLLFEGSNKHVESRAIERKLIRSSCSAFKNSFFLRTSFFPVYVHVHQIWRDFDRQAEGSSRDSRATCFVKSNLGLVSIMLIRYTLADSFMTEILIFARKRIESLSNSFGNLNYIGNFQRNYLVMW